MPLLYMTEEILTKMRFKYKSNIHMKIKNLKFKLSI